MTKAHLCTVTSYDIEENALQCIGPVKASSESLSHAAVYECAPEIGAVSHVHHAGLWTALLHTAPTTGSEIAYGTPEMAREIKRLYRESTLPNVKPLAMAGHQDGLISFGKDLDESVKILRGALSQWSGQAHRLSTD